MVTDRPPAGLIEVHLGHAGATERHTYTCANASVSLLFTEGREEAGVKLALADGKDAAFGPVLDVLYPSVAWVIVRPAVVNP